MGSQGGVSELPPVVGGSASGCVQSCERGLGPGDRVLSGEATLFASLLGVAATPGPGWRA